MYGELAPLRFSKFNYSIGGCGPLSLHYNLPLQLLRPWQRKSVIVLQNGYNFHWLKARFDYIMVTFPNLQRLEISTWKAEQIKPDDRDAFAKQAKAKCVELVACKELDHLWGLASE